jgi:outer membrane receptor for Fe3+-dicitrate
MSTVTKWLARLANTLRIPGFVRVSDYTSTDSRITVRVRCGSAFTVISVNNVDIYFDRLSGRIDGISYGQKPRSRQAAAGKSGRSDEYP